MMLFNQGVLVVQLSKTDILQPNFEAIIGEIVGFKLARNFIIIASDIIISEKF